MWRPAERIQFEAKHGRVPTRAEADASRLFSPVKAGPVALEQRTWVPAMVPWRATDDGFVTDAVIEWYARFARGRPGVIVVEATGIRDIPSGPLMRIGDDRFIPGLKKLVEAVREASEGHSRLFIQVIDFLNIRRRPDAKKYFERFLAITDAHRAALGGSDNDIRGALAAMKRDEFSKILTERELESLEFGYRERVTDMDLPHIRDLPQVLPGLFADAALRAQEAGFDGVELHYAHAYTMASFLSRKNTRDDGYGGSLRKPRAAAARSVQGGARANRREIRGRLPVPRRRMHRRRQRCRGCGLFRGAICKSRHGFHLDLARRQVRRRQAAGCRRRRLPLYRAERLRMHAAIYLRRQRPVRPQCRCRRRRSARRSMPKDCETPVVCTGGVHNFEFAEKMLADGVCDIVGSARQTLADPDWFLKTRLGLGDSVRICEFTNYCEGLDQKHKTVTCQLWDKEDLANPKVSKTADGKRRLDPPDWTPPSMSVTRTIEISEVGMRDGLQIERAMIPAEQKIALIDKLSKTGLKKIEITGFVHPKVIPQLADAETVAAGIRREPGVRYAAFVPNARGAERAIKAGIDDLKAGIAVSDSFNRLNVRMTTEDGMKAIDEIAAATKGTNSRLVGAIATAFGCPYEGEVSRRPCTGWRRNCSGMVRRSSISPIPRASPIRRAFAAPSRICSRHFPALCSDCICTTRAESASPMRWPGSTAASAISKARSADWEAVRLRRAQSVIFAPRISCIWRTRWGSRPASTSMRSSHARGWLRKCWGVRCRAW